MTASQLRVFLKEYDQDRLINLAIDMYKMIPKAKKDYHSLDALITAPPVVKIKATAKTAIISDEINWYEEEMSNCIAW